MADSKRIVENLVTRLCAAKVCQNMSKYDVIESEMKKKSKAMGYGENLSVIPPFAYSHFLYEVIRIYEKDVETYETIRELYLEAIKPTATAAAKAAFNARRGEIDALNAKLKVKAGSVIPNAQIA